MTKKSAAEKANDDWMQKKWRPAMGWMYMAVCMFDFIIAPILWSVVQFWETEAVNDAFRQWSPLTLQGAGLFHMAMGAVLGIAAYGRTQEKMSGSANNPMGTVESAPSFAAPTPTPSFATSAPVASATFSSAPAASSFSEVKTVNGKKAPVQPDFPEI